MILKVTSRIVRWGRLLYLPFFGCSRNPLSDRIFTLLFLFVFLLFAVQPLQAVELTTDNKLATAGYFQLSWKSDAENFELQQSNSDQFASYKVIYQGKDLARVISGKPDGDYYYRVLANSKDSSAVSDVVRVTVKHHSLYIAILFFIAGAIVFISTFILIINNTRKKTD